MPKILVTGGAGFIASALAAKLAENAENTVVIVDNLETGTLEKIPANKLNNIKFIRADVNEFNDISSIFYSYNFDQVFHYAALVGVKRTLDNPVKVLDDVTGISNIMHLSKSTGVKHIYYSSSSEVYGEPVEFPQNEETTPLNSRLPYAIVKNMGEAYLRSYQKEYGLNYTIFRFFNTYGPKQSRDFVISRFINWALKNEDILIHGDGLQTRTFCYISDNVDATVNAFYGQKYMNDVVNIGSDLETTVLDLARIIIKLSGSSSKIVHLPKLEEGDMTRRKPDTSKMKLLLSQPLIPLETGLKKILDDPKFIL